MKQLKQALWFRSGESRLIDGLKLAIKAFDAWLIIFSSPYNSGACYWFFEALEADIFHESKEFVKDQDGFYSWRPF
jgi:hypothetical protein